MSCVLSQVTSSTVFQEWGEEFAIRESGMLHASSQRVLLQSSRPPKGGLRCRSAKFQEKWEVSIFIGNFQNFKVWCTVSKQDPVLRLSVAAWPMAASGDLWFGTVLLWGRTRRCLGRERGLSSFHFWTFFPQSPDWSPVHEFHFEGLGYVIPTLFGAIVWVLGQFVDGELRWQPAVHSFSQQWWRAGVGSAAS